MFKKIAVMVVSLMVAAVAMCACSNGVVETYHTYAVVDSFSNTDQTVTIIREDGHIFTHDLLNGQMPQIGDTLYCEYATNGTNTVTDDEIIWCEFVK